MNEAGFIRALRSRLPDHLAVWKVSDRITKGVPDLAIFGPDGTLLWLEAKYSKTNYKTHVKPNLSLPQVDWLNQRHDTGHLVGVIFGQPAGITLFWNKTWTSSQPIQNRTWNETIASITARLALRTTRGDYGPDINNNGKPMDRCTADGYELQGNRVQASAVAQHGTANVSRPLRQV